MMSCIPSCWRQSVQLMGSVQVRVWRMFCNKSVSRHDFAAAQEIWDYMLMGHTLIKSDVILVLGNHDLRTAEYASRLFIDGMADWLMFSGKVGVLTKGKWSKSEAEVFKDVAVSKEIPQNKIILETQATNTGENVTFSYNLLKSINLLSDVRRLILVQMPHMERRVYATFMKQWPGNLSDLDIRVTSPPIPLSKYPDPHVGTMSSVITVMMGCLYRLKTYPDTGFQIYQHIPEHVWDAYLTLLRTGKYSGHIPE